MLIKTQISLWPLEMTQNQQLILIKSDMLQGYSVGEFRKQDCTRKLNKKFTLHKYLGIQEVYTKTEKDSNF